MSVTLDPIVNSNTFGVWKNRTNEIIQELESVAQIGSASDTNAIGDLIIRGNISGTGVLTIDTIQPYTAGQEIVLSTSFKIDDQLTITNGGSGTASIQLQDDGLNTWSITTDGEHDLIDIKKGATFFRVDASTGEITGSNDLVISSNIMPTTDSISEGTSNKYYSDDRARNALSVAEGSSIQYDPESGEFDFVLPHIPDYGVTAKKALTRTAVEAGDDTNYTFGVNVDDSSIKISTTSNQLYVPDSFVRGLYSQGTGVTINNDGEISIGQAVGTADTVTFGSVTSGGNVNVKSGADTKIQLKASDGSIVAEGDITAFGTASDERLKENIESIDGALEKVNSIGGYTFNYIDTPDVRMSGVIAQEIEKVLPEVVYEYEQDDEVHKAVRYGNIVPLLIEAIKELKAEVDELKRNK